MRPADNPFRSERVVSLSYRFRSETWDGLLRRLRELRFRGALVGPRGSGKTTLLEELAARLSSEGVPVLLRSAPEGAGVGWTLDPPPARADVVLLDSAERLPRLAWLRLRIVAARAAGLVVTTHRPGLLPTLATCGTDLALLEELLAELLGGPPQAPALAAARAAFELRGGDLRATFRDLYDLAAAGRLPGLPGEPAQGTAPDGR